MILGGAGLKPDGTPQIMTNPAIIPDVCSIDLDYKFMPDEDFEDVKAEFEAFVHHFAQTDPWLRENPPRIQWDLYGLNFPPMNTPTDHPLVKSLMARATAVQDRAPVAKGFDAVTDAAHYAGAGVDARDLRAVGRRLPWQRRMRGGREPGAHGQGAGRRGHRLLRNPVRRRGR